MSPWKEAVLSSFVIFLVVLPAQAQPRPPIIDVHLHALAADSQGPPPLAMCTPLDFPAWDPAQPYGATFMAMLKQPACKDPVWSPKTDQEVMTETIEVMKRRNIFGVLSGTPDRVADWMKAAPGRFIPGFQFQIGRETASPETLRALRADGRLAVLAEVTNQYAGIAPDDARMEPYWALAEELDIPVGIHIGVGPPGVIYLGSTGYRARLHSALTLEEVLVRHPRLRVYVMHAGSDQMVWPGVIERSIAVIDEAPFLDAVAKRDVLYNNAARFLRLGKDEIARHHRE
jgi:hypothetical protein